MRSFLHLVLDLDNSGCYHTDSSSHDLHRGGHAWVLYSYSWKGIADIFLEELDVFPIGLIQGSISSQVDANRRLLPRRPRGERRRTVLPIAPTMSRSPLPSEGQPWGRAASRRRPRAGASRRRPRADTRRRPRAGVKATFRSLRGVCSSRPRQGGPCRHRHGGCRHRQEEDLRSPRGAVECRRRRGAGVECRRRRGAARGRSVELGRLRPEGRRRSVCRGKLLFGWAMGAW